MSSPTMEGFSHRFRSDGTVDSICRRCFKTIGTTQIEKDLQFLESYHVCEPDTLSRYHDSSLDHDEKP